MRRKIVGALRIVIVPKVDSRAPLHTNWLIANGQMPWKGKELTIQKRTNKKIKRKE
ncbi:MAG: hypothetical protein J0H55_04580 [Chitinophagaceae bacterium]|nr:hypothetical protein [Chitinophagaceae bacterium]